MKLILDHAKFDLLPIGTGTVAEGAMMAIADLDGSGIIVQAPLELDALETIAKGMQNFVDGCRRAGSNLEVVHELPAELKRAQHEGRAL